MIEWLATNIIDGHFTFSKVPKRLKKAVKKLLIEKGYEDLTKE